MLQQKYCSNLVLFTYLLKLYQSQAICTAVQISMLGIHVETMDFNHVERT